MNFILNNIIFFWKLKKFLFLNKNLQKLGAATFNIKNINFLISKKKFNILFVQECFREFDSILPNNKKLFIHNQIQVLCKPIIFNFINIYIDSIYFIFEKITFKKDNWKSPILGAKGIGFESTVKNLEISQITIFYLFGNKKLYIPILEITYGLERIFFIFYTKIFYNEKYFSINNFFETKNIKILIYIYKKFFSCYNKKNFKISYKILLKISNLFNVFDNLYYNKNYNRIKILILINKLSEKIIEKI
ncbi:glycine--tRNA ligase subunit alpha [Candidatus Carsonella ruddii]|uniref:Glycine--tRNA ligase alpha subunit n=1 Tax=Candidatus Carsonella ruddii PC isolate NHV TaxID=1202540 RepID=J3VR51_CARRU|nr:glycine--tRNA ligase subunit alpha [Candidatus Carsonella ruddii]AFP84406.1 glycyl-tRNA synthetase alpha subunit [Candidatus Carsonella ruddii PC isolate NHV]